MQTLSQLLLELYSRANQQVQNLLKPGWDGQQFDPENYWPNFCDWLEDHLVAYNAALRVWGLDIHADDIEEAIRALPADASYQALPASITDAYEKDLEVYLEGRGAHLAPTSAHLTAQRETLLPRTTWLVHFTYQAEAVAQQGFRKGFSDPRRMGLTAHYPEDAPEKAGVGYNFAFLAQAQDAINAAGTGKYGNGAVMFQSSGVQAYHKGDEEVQVMFRGDQVDPSHLVHLKMWSDHSWSVMSKVTRRALYSASFEQCTTWVEQHYQQYRNQFAVTGNPYNKQTMQLNETVLQEAIARYCSQHQDDIAAGLLTEEQLLENINQALLSEGIVTGIQGLFAPGSAARQAVSGLADKAVDAFHSAKGAVQQGVEKLHNDYTVGNASGELRRLAQQRGQAEEQFTAKMATFKQNVALIQQQRYALRREHRALLRSFHQHAHEQYVRAAQALNIPVTKGDAFYDAVDQALESRNMVPTVLNESWGQLDEGRWSYKPTPEEAENQFQIQNRRKVLPASNEVAQKMADAGQELPNGRQVNVFANHQTQNGERASTLGALNVAAERRRLSQWDMNQGTQGGKNLRASAHQWLDHAKTLNDNPAVVAPLREEETLEEAQAFPTIADDPTDPAVAAQRAAERATPTNTPRAQAASALDAAGELRRWSTEPMNTEPSTDRYGNQTPNPAAAGLRDSARTWGSHAKELVAHPGVRASLNEDELPAEIAEGLLDNFKSHAPAAAPEADLTTLATAAAQAVESFDFSGFEFHASAQNTMSEVNRGIAKQVLAIFNGPLRPVVALYQFCKASNDPALQPFLKSSLGTAVDQLSNEVSRGYERPITPKTPEGHWFAWWAAVGGDHTTASTQAEWLADIQTIQA